MSFLLLVGLLGFIGWLVFRARGRLRRAEDEARAREAAFLQDLAQARSEVPARPAAGRAAAPGGAAVPASPEPVTGGGAGVSGPGGVAYLSAESARTFRLLRTALPDHEIFPRASLRRILGPLAPGKDLKVDFVVCSAEFHPVAVVDLAGPEDMPPVVALKSERLAAAGVTYARWDGQALPAVGSVAESLLGGRKQP